MNSKESIEVLPEGENVCPPIDLTMVRFTIHALEQFVKLFPDYAEDRPEQNALMLLARATERNAITKRVATERLANHGSIPARYFRVGACRFVVVNAPGGVPRVRAIEYYR